VRSLTTRAYFQFIEHVGSSESELLPSCGEIPESWASAAVAERQRRFSFSALRGCGDPLHAFDRVAFAV